MRDSFTTRSEQAGHARAQLEVIAASLDLQQLERLLIVGFSLLEQAERDARAQLTRAE
jgi:hypothetical protein